MTSTSTKDDGVVYVGIPLLNHQDDDTQERISSSNDGVQTTNTRSSQGLLAFIVGIFLASIGWVANQGWTVVSLLLFGEFNWSSIATTLPHILLCVFGALLRPLHSGLPSNESFLMLCLMKKKVKGTTTTTTTTTTPVYSSRTSVTCPMHYKILVTWIRGW